MKPLIDLRGKNAVVTGGSRGVGRATALLLAQAGASVGIGYRSRDDEAQETVEALLELGVQGWAEAGDISNPTDVEQLFDRSDREFDGLDIFVGNAGIWVPQDIPLSEMKESHWRRTLSVNLDSIFFSTRAAMRRIREGGAIVLVGSTAGQRGEAFHGDYAASKGAMQSLVKGLCVEMGPRGVTVNCVAPGWIDTDMAHPAYGDGGKEEIARGIPIGRVAEPEDVAGPIVFLCSALGRHITGEIMNVNGGAVLVG
jgi:3-oxoacyl-[acyl-carrier protein] reductase